MEVRRLVRVVYHKRKKYYLITPCVTICENHFGYAMPVTTIEASASYDVLYDAIIDVMEKDCRLPNKDEDGWIVNDDPPEKRFSRAYFRQDFKKKFGYYYGSLVQTATSIILMERLSDGSYVFEMWSADGMSKERMVCPAESSRDEIIQTLSKALKQSEDNRAARPKYY